MLYKQDEKQLDGLVILQVGNNSILGSKDVLKNEEKESQKLKPWQK